MCSINIQVFYVLCSQTAHLFLTHINEIWQIDRTYSLYSELNCLPLQPEQAVYLMNLDGR